MRVSIAMATYNGAQYLREQLDSLAAQTRPPDELVVTDDGSTDSTLEILADFAKSAPFPVRLFENPINLGYNKNFEKAAKLCTGDIVFFCDQDDVWLPQKIDTVVNEFCRSKDIMVVMNDANVTDSLLNPKGFTQFYNIRLSGLTLEYFNTGCCSAHRKCWQELALPLPDEAPYFDMWINLFAKDCGLALFIPRPLQLYRRHGENASDYILSEKKGSVVSLLFSKGIWNVSEGWNRRIQFLKEELSRLERTNSPIPIVEAHRNVAALLNAWTRRVEASEKSRLTRSVHVIGAIFSGEYKYFSGWKSALKDLIRP